MIKNLLLKFCNFSFFPICIHLRRWNNQFQQSDWSFRFYKKSFFWYGYIKFFHYYKRFVLDGFTGIVIAGFNRENLFPSYVHILKSLFWMVLIHFRWLWRELCGETAVILKPFAQINAITNFLNGIDVSTNYLIASYFKKVIDDYSNNIEDW